jgi:ring-1,2-phenylacetyl-CoA epoxidase subunit PaaC
MAILLVQWLEHLIVSSFEYLLFTALCASKNATIAAIAAKAVKEAKYHFIHSRDWCYRLGKGTEESHKRLQNGFNEFWMFTGELFEMNEDSLRWLTMELAQI